MAEIICYCLMPNHYHLMVRQLIDGGVSKMISDVFNSLTRIYNIKIHRTGPIFLSPFKAVEINSLDRFIHVSRYIHLQPYSSGLVTNQHGLFSYPWSSLPVYVSGKADPLVSRERLMNEFDNNQESYRTFVLNNADYQKSLEYIKYREKWY